MSLLTIIQDVAAELSLDRPSFVVGNPDPNVAHMLRLAQRVGSDLLSRGTWQALRAERTFNAIPGNTQDGEATATVLLESGTGPVLLEGTDDLAAPIPLDFGRFVPETFWDRTNHRLITGPVDAVRWQSLVGTTYDGPERWFTRRGNTLLIVPAMQGGEAMVFEYYTTAFIVSAAGALLTRWAADTDQALLPEELFTLGLIYFFSRDRGLPFEVARADYELRIKTELKNDQPDSQVMTAGDMFGTVRHSGGTPAPDFWGYRG
ncbi:hypothetical protein EOD42_23240 [Rhodovarius crocodyli]|uniref:Uncharacterized protein n=1 Tax=Rhodovarius crocodyli TaxID=1979269 RepID=A0A437LZ62_9PROT|nr:hypothetical protein [Rhodovarius crocodyli]RVT90719.1 hypothetical protein EOD42_23240 [Rhodovarius crocodyli]